ncbi:hypothetical protein EXIGLDRAFT_233184 [Exidia glandulosa HHB12029]|uniref:Uncharacterized protein n=1 Tax=Exidia glandulosa HHB12029 TaxID=1314781 RepID=A0A165E375_EXIGL|nr:hypothetical protein EXIGLDRAFT_233184 [Exidia glandulosa HHB12029]
MAMRPDTVLCPPFLVGSFLRSVRAALSHPSHHKPCDAACPYLALLLLSLRSSSSNSSRTTRRRPVCSFCYSQFCLLRSLPKSQSRRSHGARNGRKNCGLQTVATVRPLISTAWSSPHRFSFFPSAPGCSLRGC